MGGARGGGALRLSAGEAQGSGAPVPAWQRHSREARWGTAEGAAGPPRSWAVSASFSRPQHLPQPGPSPPGGPPTSRPPQHGTGSHLSRKQRPRGPVSTRPHPQRHAAAATMSPLLPTAISSAMLDFTFQSTLISANQQAGRQTPRPQHSDPSLRWAEDLDRRLSTAYRRPTDT